MNCAYRLRKSFGRIAKSQSSWAPVGLVCTSLFLFGIVGCGDKKTTQDEASQPSAQDAQSPTGPTANDTVTPSTPPSYYSPTRDPQNVGGTPVENIQLTRIPTVPPEAATTQFSGPLEIHDSGDPEVNAQVQNLLSIASSAQERNDFGPASNFLQQALAIERSRFDESHWRVQDTLFSLRYLQELAALSPTDLATIREATELHVKAYDRAAQGNYGGAVEFIDRAQALRIPLFGTKHVTSLRGRADKLQWLVLMRQFEQAEPLVAPALADSLEIYGASHPETASLQWTVGLLYFATDRMEEAEVHFQNSLACHRHFPSSSSDYSEHLIKLAGIYETQKQFAQAEPLYQEAAAIRKHIDGEGSQSHLGITIRLATMYIQVKQYSKAEPLLENAHRSLYDERMSNPLYSNICVLRARASIEQGNLTTAEALVKEALTIRTSLTGKNHYTFAGSLYMLGDIQARGGNWAQAEVTLVEALDRYFKLGGDRTPSYVACAHRLAEVHSKLGKFDEALALSHAVLERDELSIGVQHPFYATDLNNLARIYITMQQYDRAKQLAEQAMAIVEENPRESLRFAESIQTLAAATLGMGNAAVAEPLLVRALEIQQSNLRPGNLSLARTLETYAVLLHSTNRSAEAATIEARARQARGIIARQNGGAPLQ